MIQIQIRRPCRGTEVVSNEWRVERCLECGSEEGPFGSVQHRDVIEWVPLTQALQMAAVEEAERIGKVDGQ